MNIIYKITYLPHLNTPFPKYYIGSKMNWTEVSKYFGSVASTQIFDYTNGMELRSWWKHETVINRHNFTFEVISDHPDTTSLELVEIEKQIHLELNILNSDYFNQSVATSGFVSGLNSENTKRKKSEATKAYWASEAGSQKKLRLAEKNRLVKSEQQKEKWKNPSEAMKNRIVTGRPKGVKDKTKRFRQRQRIQACEDVFDDAESAADFFNLNKRTIHRRCQLEEYTEWKYID